MVERGEHPRDVVGLGIGGGGGGAEADMGRRRRQRRQHGQRLEARGEARVHARLAGKVVAEEDEVELPPLGDAGDLLHHRQILEALCRTKTPRCIWRGNSGMRQFSSMVITDGAANCVPGARVAPQPWLTTDCVHV
jgi:hypothetical protein